MLIHANRQWETSVNAHLWLYAVSMAIERVNNTPRIQSPDKKLLMQQFAKTKAQTNVKHWHPFGSPVYVLESELQKQGIFGKWTSCANKGIYLGQSPHHSRNASMPLRVDCGKQTRLDDRQEVVRAEGAEAPMKLKQRELNQREWQFPMRRSFIRTRKVSKMWIVSTWIQNPRHPTARRVGYINAGDASMGRIKGAGKAQLGASSMLRIIG
jgi:hypothetical protein